MRTLILVAAVLAGLVRPSAAHPAPFSYIDVRVPGAAVELSLVLHVLDIAHDLGVRDPAALLEPQALAERRHAIADLLRPRLQLWAEGQRIDPVAWSAPVPMGERDAVRVEVRYVLPAPPARLTLTARLFPYDPVHQTFVNVYDGAEISMQTILSKDREQFEFFTGTRQGTFALVGRFAAAGVHHILIGPDHLLFLVGLLLLGGSLRQLVLVVSAFTVAHSITLSLAVLNVVSPPAWIVEPAIALSIVYVGADNLTVRGGRDLRAWIAFAFGLLHGFGFAYVLREMELPRRALGWSLLSFNLGVEAGQLMVVVAVASLLALIRRRSPQAAAKLAYAGSLAVIAAGTFWFVQRVFF